MSTKTAITDADLVRIVQAYYDAVDSRDAARVADTYIAAPNTTLQFNADEPIVTVEAIKDFTAGFFRVVSVKHTMIDIWTTPLMGDVVPVDLAPARSASTVTVVSTALPTFTVGEDSAVKRLGVPATSIFTIDIESEKFVSVHNMFDIAKVYAAVGG
ncbi:ketosteroid isomerase family protein [Streptomyces mirabilis]